MVASKVPPLISVDVVGPSAILHVFPSKVVINCEHVFKSVAHCENYHLVGPHHCGYPLRQITELRTLAGHSFPSKF